MLRALIEKNFWLKAFSLMLATLMWLAVSYNAGLETLPGRRSTEIKREFASLPVMMLSTVAAVDRDRVQIEPSHVKVQVSGEPERIQALKSEDVRVFVQLQPGQKPDGPIAVEVVAPQAVSVTSVLPNAVLLKLAESP